MPNDRGYNGDGGRYIREDDDRRYGGSRGSSYEDDSYARRYSDGASNRNTWTEGARSAQGRSNQTFSGRDYEDTGDYRERMAGEDRYGRERWSERRNDGERYQDTSRYGRSTDESRYGYGRYANEKLSAIVRADTAMAATQTATIASTTSVAKTADSPMA